MRQRWLSRLAITSAAVGIAALATATPAWADGTIPINDGNVPTTAADFETQNCEDILDFFGNVFKSERKAAAEEDLLSLDGWHFILPADSGDDFVKLTLQFETPDGDVEVTIPGESDDPAWFGVLGEAGGKDNKHAYLLTEAGWTLVGGTADVTGDQGEKAKFNLSHTCGDIFEETPTTPPTSPTSPSESTPGETSSAPGGGGGGTLPLTGTAVGGIIVVGVGLVAAGVALMAVRRRREIDLTDI